MNIPERDARCKCTLRDAASARHCRWCDPQNEIEDMLFTTKQDEEEITELEEIIIKLQNELELVRSEAKVSKRAAQIAQNEVTQMKNKCATYERKLSNMRKER